MSDSAKLASLDVLLLIFLWIGAVSLSGNPTGFITGTVGSLVYACLAVGWRVYARASRLNCLRLRHAIFDGAITGGFLGALNIVELFYSYALAAGVWWDGSDGSDVSDWRLWLFHLLEHTIFFGVFGGLVGIVLWLFNACLLLWPFSKSKLEPKI